MDVPDARHSKIELCRVFILPGERYNFECNLALAVCLQRHVLWLGSDIQAVHRREPAQNQETLVVTSTSKRTLLVLFKNEQITAAIKRISNVILQSSEQSKLE